MSRGSSGGGTTVTQIGGANEAALASIDAQADMTDQSNRFGLISKLLDYLQSGKQIDAQERLSYASLSAQERIAKISADANAQSANLALQSANLAYQSQAAQTAAQLQAQLAAYRAQQSNSNNQMWGNLLNTGLQSFLPLLGSWFGGSNSNNNSGGGGFGNINLGTFGSGGGYGGSPDWGGWW